MLEPQFYPELVARALVLDDAPFEAMIDDDNPWVEGLALTAVVGITAGIAQSIGAWLTAMSLPDPTAVENALITGWRQFAAVTALPPEAVDAIITRIYGSMAALSGYNGVWGLFTPLIATPFWLIIWWLFFGLVAFAAARVAGGHGTLNRTLGAAALMVAPQILLVLSIVPFVGVSALLLNVWGLLIGYRAVQVTHNLTWRRAAIVTLIPYIAALLVLPLLAVAFVLGFTAGGYR